MKRVLIAITGTLLFVQASAYAAPIGIPGATVGTNKSMITAEVNLLSERDLSVKPAGPAEEVESTQFMIKGEVGLNKRVDLNVRLGFGDFEVTPGVNQINTDTGPLFGIGFKVTWANLPDANVKIGTVVQTLRMRGEQDGVPDDGLRRSFSEYDLAIGAYYDPPKDRAQKKKELILLPYGGLVWSGVDLNDKPREDDAFGVFFGTVVKTGGKTQFGVELRIPDQTAVGISASYLF